MSPPSRLVYWVVGGRAVSSPITRGVTAFPLERTFTFFGEASSVKYKYVAVDRYSLSLASRDIKSPTVRLAPTVLL
jgi:hypothetical protein